MSRRISLFTLLLLLLSLCLAACGSGDGSAEGVALSQAPSSPAYVFRNPYYTATSWPIRLDEWTPVGMARLPRPQDIYYPHEPDAAKPGLYLDYRKAPATNDYAGFWDDVYVSQDNSHSFLVNGWTGRDGNGITGLTSSLVTAAAPGPVALTLGANFTSQSTTGMGHDLANAVAPVTFTERDYYFANCLRAGPAHISYMDRGPSASVDAYQALVPSLYNSVGSSGSEVAALGKLILAAGYLPRQVKADMKRAGIYPASLLYIWKAALPYDVPYDDELRHRVAYYSTGDHADYTGSNQTEYNFHYHRYDDNLHMKNMVRIAKAMAYPPPVAILKRIAISGGTVMNGSAKTSWLIHQAAGQPVSIQVSPADSYDIYQQPLSFRMTMIHGDPGTVITRDPQTQAFSIFVPGTAGLPRGRTTILLIANNGHVDSNPAAINIYRTTGAANRRPLMNWPADKTLLPGETYEATVSGTDPEGFPVKVSRWSGEVGELRGNRFTWNIPKTRGDGVYKAHFIATDGTAGNSHESREVVIVVRSTVAELTADTTEGAAPLTVRFDAAGSRDKAGGALRYQWDFDDGATSNAADPAHVFANPGYYRVRLTVTGASAAHSATTLIHAAHDWKARLRVVSHDPQRPAGENSLTSVADLAPPLYFEAEYVRAQTEVAGAGFQVLDALVGFTAAAGNTPRNEYIAAPDADGAWTGAYIAERVRDSWVNSRIRLYVTADPNHPGRYRYQGILINEWGTALIRLDDRPAPATGKIRMLNSEPRSRIDLYSAQVFTR